MANPSLPQELILEIISRLPQKTIGKCKCLSKSYLSILSTTEFLNLCLNHQFNLILITQSHSLHLLLSTPLINNNAVSRKLDFSGSWTQVIGSCNGLVLLTNKECELYLLNVVTNVMSRIPDFELCLKKNESKRTHGFGYDGFSHDYKIVTLSYYPDMVGAPDGDTFVDVYSVKMGVWKRVDKYPFEVFKIANDPLVSGVFVGGAIHWLAEHIFFGGRNIVAKFDLAKEVFYDIRAPKFLHASFKSLFGRMGGLCGVSSYYKLGGGDIWTMEKHVLVEECGLVAYWKKFTIPENENWPKVKPVCFVGEEGVVLRAEDGRLFVYDMKAGTMKEFVVDGLPAWCMDMGIGSLDMINNVFWLNEDRFCEFCCCRHEEGSKY